MPTFTPMEYTDKDNLRIAELTIEGYKLYSKEIEAKILAFRANIQDEELKKKYDEWFDIKTITNGRDRLHDY